MDTTFCTPSIVIFLRSLFPKKAPLKAKRVVTPNRGKFSTTLFVENSFAYTVILATSMQLAITVPVPINCSFDKPDLARNADLKAPWCPERPPKKPLMRPPTGRYFLSISRLLNFGMSSNNVKAAIKIASISFTGRILNSFPQSKYVKSASKFEICPKVQAPTIAARTAGIPNRRRMLRFANLPTKKSLNSPLRKWTIAVRPTASSIGKKSAKTGVNKVPRPNPEKKVRSEAPAATKGIITKIKDDLIKSTFATKLKLAEESSNLYLKIHGIPVREVGLDYGKSPKKEILHGVTWA